MTAENFFDMGCSPYIEVVQLRDGLPPFLFKPMAFIQ
jgi:hypothetical protein